MTEWQPNAALVVHSGSLGLPCQAVQCSERRPGVSVSVSVCVCVQACAALVVSRRPRREAEAAAWV